MRLLIMGAGSLGSVVGGLMAKSGHEVTLIGRAPHMDAIRQNGLHITGIWGEHLISNLTVATDTSACTSGGYDLILVTVKSYDTARAAEAIAPLVGPETLVCSYQNGLGNAETLAKHIPPEQVFGARAIYGARLPENGHVDVTVIAAPTALGTYHPDSSVDRVREIAEAMDDAGLPTEYTDSIATVLWSKVAYNCALNPMSALLDVPYGVVVESEETREIIHEVIHELYTVGRAMGISLEPDSPEAYLKFFYEELIPPTATHYASMREDFRRKRPTEIDALNGAICRYGTENGIACPVNETLTQLVHAREQLYQLQNK